jgi:predicted enzyme related to lactoylglutathione lyase
MTKTPSTIVRKACLLLPLLFLAVSAFAEVPVPAPTPKILYVGAISINPCQEAKVLADWYARLGIETKEFKGEYFAKIETAAGTVAFGIHPRKADAPKKSSASVAVVFRVENFDEYLASLKAKGLAPEAIEKDLYGQFAHFHDPDGNEVTLWGK